MTLALEGEFSSTKFLAHVVFVVEVDLRWHARHNFSCGGIEKVKMGRSSKGAGEVQLLENGETKKYLMRRLFANIEKGPTLEMVAQLYGHV